MEIEIDKFYKRKAILINFVSQIKNGNGIAFTHSNLLKRKKQIIDQ